MNILVTGSKGMVGTHLCYQLKRQGSNVFEIDIKDGTDINYVDDYKIPKVDLIVHLAATCSTSKGLDNPREAFYNNSTGTLSVFEFARKNKTPVIYTSSIKAVANERGQRTPYGLTKFMGEEIAREWNLTYDVPYIINRPGTMYGPFQSSSPESGWLGWFIKAAVEHSPITIYGDGNQVRDVLFVDDYVRLLIDQIKMFDLYALGTYEVGGGSRNAISLLQALEFLHVTPDHFEPARIGDAQRYVTENGAVRRAGRWAPLTTWEDGITETLNYFKRKAT